MDDEKDRGAEPDVPYAQHKALMEEYAQFAYIVSHDLKAPLRHIREFTKLLVHDRESLAEGEEAEFSGIVLRSVERADSIIYELLLLSRLSTQLQPFDAIALKDVVGELIETITPDGGEFDLSVSLGELPSIQGDEGQISALFRHLLNNSIKFRSPDVPLRINIEYADVDDTHVITVGDNGLGLPENLQGAVFQMFKKGHNLEGMGTGLAHCRKIMSNHGGDISMTSAKGEGCIMTLRFPGNTMSV